MALPWWGLQVFDRVREPLVRRALLLSEFGTLRLQVGPNAMRPWGGAKHAAELVTMIEGEGYHVLVSPISGPADWDHNVRGYVRELTDRLPSRDWCLSMELNDPKLSPPGGLPQYVADVPEFILDIHDSGGRAWGPGQTAPHLDIARRVLGDVRFDVVCAHAYPDRGFDAFCDWLDECEATFRMFGYTSGCLDETGAHGYPYPATLNRPGTWLPALLAALGRWGDADAVQAERLARVRELVEQRPFWTSAYIYQIADRYSELHSGFGLYRANAKTPKPALAVFKR